MPAKSIASNTRFPRSVLRTALTISLLSATVLGASASLAADRDDPMAERIATDRIIVTWSERAAVDVYVGTEAAASIQSMRLVSDDDRDGRHELQLTDDRRPYFLLISERGKQRAAERLLPLEKGSNFRDVGGYPAANGRHVRWGSIYRSGATPVLSDRDIAYVRALGIGSMVDFRAIEERQLAPTRLKGQGIRYIAVDYPFSKLTAENPASVSPYQRLLAAMTPQYRALFDELLAHKAPVSYNCTAGQDRTGIATALILSALGVPRDIILEDYHLSTAHRRPENEMPQFDPADFPDNPLAAYSATVRDSQPSPLYSADGRSYLASLFDAIDARWGSVEAYLEQVLAVDDRDVARLRAMYLE